MVLTRRLALELVAIGVEVKAAGIFGLAIWGLPIYSILHMSSGE